MKKFMVLALITSFGLILTGCNKEEKLKIQQQVEDFKPMKKYSAGRAEQYVVEAKTADEIAAEVFKEQIGILNNTETSFGISGNVDETNVFVHAMIADGSNIPTLSGFSAKDITDINANGGVDAWAEKNEVDYAELIEQRNVVSESLDGVSEQKLSESIQDAITSREEIQNK